MLQIFIDIKISVELFAKQTTLCDFKVAFVELSLFQLSWRTKSLKQLFATLLLCITTTIV